MPHTELAPHTRKLNKCCDNQWATLYSVVQLKDTLIFTLIPFSYHYLLGKYALEIFTILDIISEEKKKIKAGRMENRGAEWTGVYFLYAEAIWQQNKLHKPSSWLCCHGRVVKPSISSLLPVSLLPHVDRIYAPHDISEHS